MRSLIISGVLLAALLAIGSAVSAGDREDDERPRMRIVYVPQDELDVLFGGKQRTMLLDWGEYLGLRRLARANETPPPPPAEVAFKGVESVLTVDGERAEGRIGLALSVLRDGLLKVRFPMEAVAVASATLDGKPAVLGRDKVGAFVVVEGKGDHRLDLNVSIRVHREDGDRFRVRAVLPAATRGFVEIRLAGRQDVITLSPHRTVYPATQDATIAGIHLDGSGSIDLRWAPLAGGASHRSLLHADVRQATLVDDDAVRLDAVVSLNVYRKPASTYRLTVPAAVTVTSVVADGLLGWSDAGGEPLRTLVLEFESPFTGRRLVRLQGEAAFPGAGETDLPLVGCVGAARFTGRVGVSYGTEISGRVVRSEGVLRADPPGASNKASSSLEAYEFWSADRNLRLLVERPEMTVKAIVRTLYQLGETTRVIDASVQYTSRDGRLYLMTPRMPAGFTVTHVLVNGKRTGFTWEETGDGGLSVHVPAGFNPGRTATLRIRAEKADPSWRDESVREGTDVIPAIHAGAGIEQSGVLGISAFSDFDVRDEGVTGYEAISPAGLRDAGIAAVNSVLAYRYRGDPGEGRLHITRREARVVAGIVTLVAPSREKVGLHARIDLGLERAGIRRVKIRVTGGYGEQVHIVGPGVRSTSRVVEEETKADIWTVEFQDLRHERVSLDVMLVRKGEEKTFVVPEITVLNCADQSGWLAVESSPGLQIGLEAEGLIEIEAERVPLPRSYAVAHGFVSAYRWVRAPYGLTVGITRFTERPVLQTVAVKSALRTRISRDGLARTRAEVTIRNTDRQFLTVTLPANSRLWAALVAGAPVKPLTEGRSVLVPLPESDGGTREFPVVLVYETKLPSLEAKGTLDLDPPDLHVAGTQFTWSIHLPDGFTAVRSDGIHRGEPVRRHAPLLVRLLHGMGSKSFTIGASEDVAGSTGSDRVVVVFSHAETDGVAINEVIDFEFSEAIEEDAKFEVVREIPTNGQMVSGRLEDAGDDAPPMAAEKRPAPRPVKAGRPMADPASPPTRQPQEDAAEFLKTRVPYSANVRFPRQMPSRKGTLSLDVGVVDGGAEAIVSAAGPAGSTVSLVYHDKDRAQIWFWFLVTATLAAGLVAVRKNIVKPLTWVVVVGAIATTAPLIFNVVETVEENLTLWDGVFLGDLLCALFFIGRAVIRRVGRPAVAAALVLVALLPCAVASAAPETRVFVPYDPTDPATLERIDKVVVPYDKFVELWNRAHPDQAIRTPEDLPVDAVLAGASYQGRVEGSSVRLEASFDIYLPRDGWVEIVLPLAPAALESATLDGEPTRVTSRKGALVAVVEKAGRHTLALTLRARAERKGPRGSLSLRIPTIPMSSFAMSVPGTGLNVTLPAHGGTRTVEKNGETRVEALLGALNSIQLKWSPRGPRRDGDLSVTGASRSLLSVGKGLANLVSEISLTFEGGKMAELVCDVTGGMTVRDVKAEHLVDWVQEDGTLRLRFRPAAAGSVTIRVTGGLETGTLASTLEVPSIVPRGLVREAGVIGVHAEAGLTLVPETVRALERASFDEKSFANLGVKRYGPRRLAYRFSRRPVMLTVAVGQQRREVFATQRTHLHVGAEEIRGRTEATFTVRGRILHELAISLPGGLEIESVACPGLRDWWTEPLEGDDGRVRLRATLVRGFTGQRVLAVTFRDTHATDGATALPMPWPLGADRASGIVLIGAPVAFDLTTTDAQGLRPASTEREKVLLAGVAAPRYAFRHDGGAHALRATLSRRTVRMRPLTTTLLAVDEDEDNLGVDTYIRVEVLRGGVKTFRVFVPDGEGDEMIWDVPGLRERTESAATIDGVTGTVHVLTLQAEATRGFSVRAVYERKIGDESLAVRGIRALDGEAGRSFVVLQNKSDLLITPDDEGGGLVSITPTDLPVVTSQNTSIYSHAWSSGQGAWLLKLAFKRFQFEAFFDKAIVTMASLITAVGPDGWSRNKMTYRVFNRSLQYLRVELPKGAVLEAALVGGRGVKPASEGPSVGPIVLVPLRRAALGAPVIRVVLVYSCRLAPGGKSLIDAGSLEPLAPKLLDLPLQETIWEVRLPAGYDYDFDGNMDEVVTEIAEVQKAMAIRREMQHLDSVRSSGTKDQQVRAGANYYQAAKEYDQTLNEAIVELQEKAKGPIDEVTRKEAALKIQELNDFLVSNAASNLSKPQIGAGGGAGGAIQLRTRNATIQRSPTALLDDVTAGLEDRAAAGYGNAQQTLARGKSGLLKQTWADNFNVAQQTARIVDMDMEISTRQQDEARRQTVLVTSSINPVDLGRRINRIHMVPELESLRSQPARVPGSRYFRFDTDEFAQASELTSATWNADLPGGLAGFFTVGAGDGSDGDFKPTRDTTLDLSRKSVLNFRSFEVPKGVTVTLMGDQPATIMSLANMKVEGRIVRAGEDDHKDYAGEEINLTPSGAGGYFNDTYDGDIRSRTVNLFDRAIGPGGWKADLGVTVSGGIGGAGGGDGGGPRGDRELGITFSEPLVPGAVALRAGVLSLDVPMPEGGHVFRFRKENGGPELAIAVSETSTGRGWVGFLWLALSLGVFTGLRVVDRRRPFPGYRAAVVFSLAVISAVYFGTLLYSIIVMVLAANVFAFVWFRRARTA
jgi:hypothetical protein